MALQNFGIQNLEMFFTSGPYFVPDYQRDYSWTDKEEIKDFWYDLCDVRDRKMSDYFIGQVVVHDDSACDKKYLIDGQQRSITSFILLRALSHFLERIGLKQGTQPTVAKKARNKAAEISGLLKVLDEDDMEDKLWLGQSDRSYFRQYFAYSDEQNLLELKPRLEKSISRKNLIKCYQYFHEKISDEVANLSDEAAYDRLNGLYTILKKSFKVLYVETTSEEEAFIIFETLNGRGRDLATSDLLKNFLIRSAAAGSMRDEIKNNWNAMSNTLKGLNVTAFIRYLWNSGHEMSREKMLYRAMTEKEKGITSPKDCLDFARQLERCAPVYKALEQPDESKAFESASISRELADLKRLRVSTFYPVVFAMFERKFSDSDVLRVLKAIETIVVRDIVIGRQSPNSYETAFSKIAVNLTEMRLSGPDEVVDELRKKCELANDDDFEAAFSTFVGDDTSSGKEKIRFLLRCIENSGRKETELILDNSVVHIEHIMPQTKGDWDVSDEDHDRFLWRLGNLTLLSSAINDSVKNALFDKKKEAYSSSDILITRGVCDYDLWRVDYLDGGKPVEGEISIRQKSFAKAASKIWTFN